MGYIFVNHSVFDKTISAIDRYLGSCRQNMKRIDNEVTSLGASWGGKDYVSFVNKWGEIKGKNSVSSKMSSDLENYKSFLKFAADRYREAQANAVNRARNLPR